MHCFVDYRISSEELDALLQLKLNPILVPKCPKVYEAIDGHPDIQLNILKNNSKNKIIIQKDIPNCFKKILEANSINYIVSKSSLSNTYPYDIILNSLILDNHFIHNLKYTDENLLKSQSLKVHINVPQGYTKCSILPIRENALITSDKGIFNILKNYNFDILLLPPGDILLPSLNYGFIGGVGGMISNNEMAFFGNLDYYKWGNEIKDFLFKYDVAPVYLRNGKLIDRGSLLIL
ncbi:DUF6873 family GME fold protein [Clostridium saccharobutylicum]|uniref:DUF6873 domain-containing protein n=1 Tax=Clostridium saccharobutylicum DSM 13864 TaxID=1345695 RepID=U5MSZ1_CLOSA|nr:hypothetical protein [Clostridium saccharobutylicum]AGX43715.1 hypothetical protein CLSA_c27440 [Clostridium saccharobutylicum DSM 13864]AQR91013.1 hypothetical protein CLOSC_27340 [Clostridium saccharobutylicum]AQS00917.1 hypothetical protein CSACC_27410 [Clostridium saccharobutylicum]AQS10655.1 hypothetical protein CLOBY_28000 [Clostridium saccharobutylicum]AQS14900.1 hypothetical protein CLOSACC_27410 [Clostridium saccharobutylicum]